MENLSFNVLESKVTSIGADIKAIIILYNQIVGSMHRRRDDPDYAWVWQICLQPLSSIRLCFLKEKGKWCRQKTNKEIRKYKNSMERKYVCNSAW